MKLLNMLYFCREILIKDLNLKPSGDLKVHCYDKIIWLQVWQHVSLVVSDASSSVVSLKTRSVAPCGVLDKRCYKDTTSQHKVRLHCDNMKEGRVQHDGEDREKLVPLVCSHCAHHCKQRATSHWLHPTTLQHHLTCGCVPHW